MRRKASRKGDRPIDFLKCRVVIFFVFIFLFSFFVLAFNDPVQERSLAMFSIAFIVMVFVLTQTVSHSFLEIRPALQRKLESRALSRRQSFRRA